MSDIDLIYSTCVEMYNGLSSNPQYEKLMKILVEKYGQQLIDIMNKYTGICKASINPLLTYDDNCAHWINTLYDPINDAIYNKCANGQEIRIKCGNYNVLCKNSFPISDCIIDITIDLLDFNDIICEKRLNDDVVIKTHENLYKSDDRLIDIYFDYVKKYIMKDFADNFAGKSLCSFDILVMNDWLDSKKDEYINEEKIPLLQRYNDEINVFFANIKNFIDNKKNEISYIDIDKIIISKFKHIALKPKLYLKYALETLKTSQISKDKLKTDNIKDDINEKMLDFHKFCYSDISETYNNYGDFEYEILSYQDFINQYTLVLLHHINNYKHKHTYINELKLEENKEYVNLCVNNTIYPTKLKKYNRDFNDINIYITENDYLCYLRHHVIYNVPLSIQSFKNIELYYMGNYFENESKIPQNIRDYLCDVYGIILYNHTIMISRYDYDKYDNVNIRKIMKMPNKYSQFINVFINELIKEIDL